MYVAGEHVLVVSSAPAIWQGREVGAVVTLRDHTELRSVTGELDVVRGLTDTLRAQTHEAANRLHTVVSLIEMGRPEDAVEFATEELEVAQRLTDRRRRRGGRPGRRGPASRQDGRGGRAGHRPDGGRRAAADGPEVAARDLVTVIGNLVDNAFDAVAGATCRRIEVVPRRRRRACRRRRRRQRARA